MFDVEFKDFIKLYKSYTKETFLFVVNYINLSSYIPLRLTKKYYKFNFGKKMKTIDSKIKQKTSQHANSQIAKISDLSSRNTGKDGFLTA